MNHDKVSHTNARYQKIKKKEEKKIDPKFEVMANDTLR